MAQKTKKAPNDVKVGKEDLVKEREDVQGLMSHLEEEYRKANVSEKHYQELKEKYEKRLKELEKKAGPVEEEKKEEEKPERKEEETKPPKEAKVKVEKKAGKKGPGLGMIGKLFKRDPKKPKKDESPKQASKEDDKGGEVDEKSEEDKLIEQAALAVGAEQEGAASMIEGAKDKMAAAVETQKIEAAEAAAAGEEETTVGEGAVASTGDSAAVSKLGVELEKTKVMINTIRDTKKATDETIQALAENIGEIRSLTFQTDGAIREMGAKIEKMEDEISDVKPTEISKKFTELNTTIEKQSLEIEKLNRKSEDLATKINKVHNMMKGAGGIENLVDLNNQIQKKITDIKSVIKYIERLAFKTEKVFIDLNKGMEDFVIYKTKQEGLDETVKDLMKSWTKVSLELENNYPTKSDLNTIREDMLGLQKEIGEISKGLPVLQAKMPAPMLDLVKEREDIILFMESLEESLKAKSISQEEYENVKNKNMEKLDILRKELRREWARLEEYSKSVGTVKEAKGAEAPKAATPEAEAEAAPEEGTKEVAAEKPEIEEPKESEEAPKEAEPPKEEEAPKETETSKEIEVKIEKKLEEEKPAGEEKAEEKSKEEEETEKKEEIVEKELEEKKEEKTKDKKKKPRPKKKVEPKKEVEEPPETKEEPEEEVKEDSKEKPKVDAEKKEEGGESLGEDEGRDESVSTLITKIRTKMKDV
jgi:hypothetical protein